MFCIHFPTLLVLARLSLCIQPFQAALHLTLPWENKLPNNNLRTLTSTSIYSAFFKPFDQKGVSPATKSYSQTEATESSLCFLNEVWLTLIFVCFLGHSWYTDTQLTTDILLRPTTIPTFSASPSVCFPFPWQHFLFISSVWLGFLLCPLPSWSPLFWMLVSLTYRSIVLNT